MLNMFACYVAHQLKHEYGMNPLLVTWSPLKYTDIGLQNFDALSDSGFTAIRCTPDGRIHRKLARLCFDDDDLKRVAARKSLEPVDSSVGVNAGDGCSSGVKAGDTTAESVRCTLCGREPPRAELE